MRREPETRAVGELEHDLDALECSLATRERNVSAHDRDVRPIRAEKPARGTAVEREREASRARATDVPRPAKPARQTDTPASKLLRVFW